MYIFWPKEAIASNLEAISKMNSNLAIDSGNELTGTYYLCGIDLKPDFSLFSMYVVVVGVRQEVHLLSVSFVSSFGFSFFFVFRDL